MNRIIIVAIVLITSACTAGALKSRNQASETKTALSTNTGGKQENYLQI
jgi:hypothetical protein